MVSRHVKGAESAVGRPLLRKGDQGPAVTELTRLLVARQHLRQSSDTFDAEVRAAVRSFQARHLGPNGRPLVPDGVVGKLTWWALTTNRMPAGLLPDTPSMPMPRGGSRLGRAALRIALAEQAAGACEVGANNNGPHVRKYLNNLTEPPANWCAGFVSWCYRAAAGGADAMPFNYSLGARDVRNQFKAKGWAFDADQRPPEPGDVVVWWRGQREGWQGHIGLVHRLEHGILYTVEGNKGSFPAPVRTFDYVLSRMDRLLGFGRVP